MDLAERLRAVTQHFEQKGVRVDSEWLSGCVQFFIEEEPEIKTNQLYQQALEQWELSDLCDSGIKCLPDCIFTEKDVQSISGRFPLQMQYLLDISESPYDQLQKLKNKEVEVGMEQPEFKQTQQKTNKKRMLKLECTDGFRTVAALEYTPIPCLTTQLSPGVKLLLSGTMRCVNNILFLTASNIQILGGEVTSMSIEYAYENVLRKALNQPMNPNPNLDYQEKTVTNDTSAAIKRMNDIPSIPMTAASVLQSNVVSSVSHAVLDDFPDDDFLTDIDIDVIASSAANAPRMPAANELPNNSTAPKPRRSTLLFDDMDDDAFLQIDSTIEQISATQDTNHTANAYTAAKMSSTTNVANVTNASNASNNTGGQIPIEPSISSENYRFKIRGVNIVTIKQIQQCPSPERVRRKHFILRAQIDGIVESARVTRNDQWKLIVLLTDEYSQNEKLEVSFRSDVVHRLCGTSGREVNELYAMRKERPQVQNEIEDILKGLTERLERMDMFMKIEFENNSDPIVVELIHPAPVLNRKLQDKIEYEKIALNKM